MQPALSLELPSPHARTSSTLQGTPAHSSCCSSRQCPAPSQELPPPAVPSQVPSTRLLHPPARQGKAAQAYARQDRAVRKVSSSEGKPGLRSLHHPPPPGACARGESLGWRVELGEGERPWLNDCLCFILCELVIAFLFPLGISSSSPG